MQQSTLHLYTHESGMVVSANQHEGSPDKVFATSLDCFDTQRAELIANFGSDLSVCECDWNVFNEVVVETHYKHFRTFMAEGEEITLSFPDNMHSDKKSYLNNAYIFHLGDGAFSFIAHEDITIVKTKKSFKKKRSIPRGALSLLDEITDSDPVDIKDAKELLGQAMFIKERLMACTHDRVREDNQAILSDALAQANTVVNRLQSAKRRLKAKPNFEATEKTILIEKLRSYLENSGANDVFINLKAEARREAAILTTGTPENKIETQWKRIEEHSFHRGFAALFENTAPPPLPMGDCMSCGSRAEVVKSFNPDTNRKRFEVLCTGCKAKATTSFSNTGSGAVVNWNSFNKNPSIKWSDITVFEHQHIAEKGHSAFLKELHLYIELYDAYISDKLKSVDRDSSSSYRAIRGKLQYLKDARTIGKQVIKFLNLSD